MADNGRMDRNTAEIDALLSKYVKENTATTEQRAKAEIESEYVAIINEIINDPGNTDFLRERPVIDEPEKEDTHEFTDTLEFGDTREILPKKEEKKDKPAQSEGLGKAKITSIRQYIQTEIDGVVSEQRAEAPRKFVINIPEDEAVNVQPEDSGVRPLDELTFDDLIAERNSDTMESREIGKMFNKRKFSDRVAAVMREITENDEDDEHVLDEEPDKGKTRKMLEKRISRETVTQTFIGLIAAVLMFMCLAQAINLGIDTAQVAFKWISLMLFVIACILGMRVFEKAFRATVRLKPNVDFIAAVFAILALIQAIVAMATKADVAIYLAFPVCIIFFARYVSLEKDKKTAADLKMLSYKPSKTCGGIMADDNLAKDITGEYGAKVAHVRHISNIKADDFFSREYSKDGNEAIISVLGWCALLASFVIFIVMLFVKKSGVLALTSAVSSLSLLVPAGIAVVGSLAYTSFSKKLRVSGATIVGTRSMNEITRAKTLVLEDRHLFPVKSLQITGIKQYGTYDNKELMIGVVSSLKALKCPLSAVMYDMIDRREDLLAEPQSVTYFDGRGIKSNVNGTLYIIGNRKMMEENKISLPEDKTAERIVANNKIPLFVANGEKVVAIFAIKYTENPEIKQRLHQLIQYGISFAVKTRDPNLTPEFISQKYDIPFGYLKLLPDMVSRREDEAFDPDSSPKIISITKEPKAYLRAHVAAFRMESACRINKALLIAAFSMGAVVTLLMLIFGLIANPGQVLVVNLIWTLPIIAVNEILKRNV